MAKIIPHPSEIRALRNRLGLTQEQFAERLGVAFTTVNRWEGGDSKPQRAALEVLERMKQEAGLESGPVDEAPETTKVGRRRTKDSAAAPTTKPMEQMLWDAACSIRGEKDAAKFKDYLLPLLFVKRLSDVFDDEIGRLAEDYGDRNTALEIAESDHSLLRFYLPAEARWKVISGRYDKDEKPFEWPLDEKGRPTAPKDIGEHLTKAVRAVVKHNPSLTGVIDIVDFAAERNGERDINPAKLRLVVETFSDPRYRLGLADVQPDFLGRAYEYLLRKFAEGSGQSAGEFFTPTEVGFLMAHIMRPRPGETCLDYACGSAGLLIKLQLVARELDPTSRVPLKLSGQELQAESYAVAQMNAIIHDMEVELARGDTMINPKFREANGKIRTHDIVVANPMWNQPFAPDLFANDPFDRFRTTGGITSGKGDWAWLQHTLSCLDEHGRAAVVLDTGAVTRGSGSKNEDKERNIRKWFVDRDLIDGVILLPENLFYNTTAAGVIVVLSKRKPVARRGKILLVNASTKYLKGKPKNYLTAEHIKEISNLYAKGEHVDCEVTAISADQAEKADYNLSPSRWIEGSASEKSASLPTQVKLYQDLRNKREKHEQHIREMFKVHASKNRAKEKTKPSEKGEVPVSWKVIPFVEAVVLQRGMDLPLSNRHSGSVPVYGSNGVVGYHNEAPQKAPIPGVVVGRSGSVGRVGYSTVPYWPLNTTLYASSFCDNDPSFVRYWLEDFDLSRFAQGVSVPTLNRNSFAQIEVAIPDKPEQEKIAAFLQVLEKKIELLKSEASLLSDIFLKVRSGFMTGDVRVEDMNLVHLLADGKSKDEQ